MSREIRGPPQNFICSRNGMTTMQTLNGAHTIKNTTDAAGSVSPTSGRGSWGRPIKPPRPETIKHPHIGRVLFNELRTGSGTRKWKSWRPADFGRSAKPQTIWNSPALARCMDSFYDKVDALIALHEREEYRRLCEEHRRFVERQEDRRKRRNLDVAQRGRSR